MSNFFQSNRALIYLLLAIIFEVCGTTSMKLANGFAKPTPSVLIFVFYTCAFIFLTLSLKRLEVSVAYAIWSGLGTLLVAIVGVLYFHEPLTALKILSLAFIILGVVGFRLT